MSADRPTRGSASEPGKPGATEDGRHEGLRERKRRQTREALVRHALALVSERGLSAVSVDNIAEAAGVSPRTFFNYFSSKEEAIVGYSAEQPRLLLALLQERPDEETPFDAMCGALIQAVTQLEEWFGQWLARDRLAHQHPELSYRYLTALTKGDELLVAELVRRFDDDGRDRVLHARLLVASVMAATRMTLTTWNDDPGSETLTERLRITLEELGNGFRGRA